LDPVQAQTSAAVPKPDGPKEPWNGEFYVSFGDTDSERSWQDAVQYGFVAAGGAPWYSRTLNQLSPGDRIWVKIPDAGFVGVGRVRSRAEPAAAFRVATPSGEAPVLEAAQGGRYHRRFADDPDRCDYFVGIDWLHTLPRDRAVHEIGLFGNQNTVCKPTTPKWRHTVERLKQKFPNWDGEMAASATERAEPTPQSIAVP
jgi:hypothetical protein